jgi:hypothetical protein
MRLPVKLTCLGTVFRCKDAARKIYAQQGVKGFYKGFGAILVNSLPASAIWWTVYEESKANVSKALDVNSQKSGEQALVVHNHTSAQLISMYQYIYILSNEIVAKRFV